jgi:NodT family efflux transporter outer membrane factor (OMF) lipoprotein
MRSRAPAFLAMTALLAGCAAGPPYAPPTVPVPASFSRQSPTAGAAETDWWKAFNDPVLTSLVTRALASNPDVQQAVARIRQARAQQQITRGGHGPQINASAQAADTRLSSNALPTSLTNLFTGNTSQAASSGVGLPGEAFSIYQAGFDASWELDLFGGQRRADKAAQARTEAADWSARDARVALAAEVANTYQQYRALQRRLAIAEATLATERDALAFAQVRFKNGLDMDSDLGRQARQVDQAAAEREDLAAQAEARLHALGFLLGLAPNALAGELSAPAAAAPQPVEAPPGLPSDLLKRRPDIRAAERQLAAATADVGVATADLYPKITLTGALQLASRSLTSLLEADSRQDNVSGRLSLPLLDRGRLRATVRLRQAQADEAAIAYRKTVFGALRDVEDALARLDADRRRLERTQASARSARDDADSAAVRYRNGLIPAGEMLGARRTWQAAQDAQVQVEAATAQDVIALYKALGGGWDEQSGATQGGKSGG